MDADLSVPPSEAPLPLASRIVVLVVAFLGWMCAGMHMSTTQLAGQAAAIDLLGLDGQLDANRYQSLSRQTQQASKRGHASGITSQPLPAGDRAELAGWKKLVARWFAWYQCAFLFGAAAGGLLLGWLGDRFGRAKGMTISILTYSLLAGAAYFSQSPGQLLVLWFLACLGVGGMWPNGVALVGECWSGISRPLVAGVIGTAANVGLFLMATIAAHVQITPDDWRWVMLVGCSPVALGLFSLAAVPESPRWLAAREHGPANRPNALPAGQAPAGSRAEHPELSEVFRSRYLRVTLVGIVLATVPMIGGWGSANWMVPWAGEAGEAADPPNPYLKAQVGQARAFTGILGSLIGGWVAGVLGRRLSFFLVSLAALASAEITFCLLVPTDRWFLTWVAILGFVSGIYFGWMPLFLPELFPTRLRSTGAGVSFNFGRIVTATTIFATGALMEYFSGDYARIGRITSLIFAVGMVVIWLAPDTTKRQLAD